MCYTPNGIKILRFSSLLWHTLIYNDTMIKSKDKCVIFCHKHVHCNVHCMYMSYVKNILTTQNSHIRFLINELMILFVVAVQTAALCKWFAAYFTLEWFFTSMNSHMLLYLLQYKSFSCILLNIYICIYNIMIKFEQINWKNQELVTQSEAWPA